MKKILILICLLFSCNLFAEDFKIEIQDYVDSLKTDNVQFVENVQVMEILPISTTVCKVVYSNGITEYLVKGEIIKCNKAIYDSNNDTLLKYTLILKIMDFTYNKITTMIVLKETLLDER